MNSVKWLVGFHAATILQPLTPSSPHSLPGNGLNLYVTQQFWTTSVSQGNFIASLHQVISHAIRYDRVIGIIRMWAEGNLMRSHRQKWMVRIGSICLMNVGGVSKKSLFLYISIWFPGCITWYIGFECWFTHINFHTYNAHTRPHIYQTYPHIYILRIQLRTKILTHAIMNVYKTCIYVRVDASPYSHAYVLAHVHKSYIHNR